MDLQVFTFNPFKTNTYLLIKDNNVLIIDPAFYYPEEIQEIDNFLKANNLNPVYVIATHGHIDHIFGLKFLKENYNVKFLMNALDIDLLEVAKKHAKFYFDLNMDDPPKPDLFIKDGDIIDFSGEKIKVVDIPGHTEGHIGLIYEKKKMVFTGDTLFKGTIGRTDLPGADYDTLLNSIYSKLLTLDDDYVVYPGHGDNTTIGYERRTNPFL